jgi:hypothetical protein
MTVSISKRAGNLSSALQNVLSLPLAPPIGEISVFTRPLQHGE